jgi:hypothetical protein
MNQTIQEASEAACLRHSEHHYPESSAIKGPDWEMRKGFCESNFRDGFIAGAEWAQPKWIPVTERLPELNQPVIIRCVKVELHYDLIYFDGSFNTKHITHWCATPDSLLSFKP